MASERPVTEPAHPSPTLLIGRAPARPAVSIRFALALAASTAVVAGAPAVGLLRGELLSRWPAGYVPVLAALVALSAAGLIGLAVRGVVRRNPGSGRSWSRQRLSLIALSVGIALAVGCLDRTGEPNVDVVEAFHFVEYAALTCLLAWAVAPLTPGHAWIWGVAGGVIVGALDEWTQWFVPNRIGEIRDVGIDAVSALCGLLLIVALELGGRPRARRLWRPLAVGGTAALVAVATCFSVIHLGTVVRDAEAGLFPTRFTERQLVEIGQARSREWGDGPIPAQGLFAREDQYLSEALWHVRRRNRAVEAADAATAWREERILETYYAPVLRVATADNPGGHALSDGQLEMIEAGRGQVADGFSDASPIPIFAWSSRVFWLSVTGAVGALAALAVVADRISMRASRVS